MLGRRSALRIKDEEGEGEGACGSEPDGEIDSVYECERLSWRVYGRRKRESAGSPDVGREGSTLSEVTPSE